MSNSIEEEGAAAQVPRAEKPKPRKKARVAQKRANVAPKRTKPAKQARGVHRAARGATKAGPARHGSKAAKVLELLKRPEGASMKELLKATNWQPHSVRGFLSGTVRKKMAMTVTSIRVNGGERTYSAKT